MIESFDFDFIFYTLIHIYIYIETQWCHVNRKRKLIELFAERDKYYVNNHKEFEIKNICRFVHAANKYVQ